MFFGSLYAIVVVLVLTRLAYKVYQQHGLHDDAKVQIQHFGTLLVISTFLLCLGVYIHGYVVNCSLGCSTFATECSSISCTVANHVPEGYVVLGSLLLVNAVAMLRMINDLTITRMQLAGFEKGLWTGLWTKSGANTAAVGEWCLRVGFVSTIVTGLVPTPASNCGVQPSSVTEVTGDDCFNGFMSNLHTNGLAYGIALATLGTLLRTFAPREVKGEWNRFKCKCGRRAIGVMAMVLVSLVFLLLPGLSFLAVFVVNNTGPAAKVDFCSHYTTQAACSGQELPRLWYTWAAERKMGSTSGLTKDGWQCEWLETVAMTSTPCVRANCDHKNRLGPRKTAIITEYLGLVNGVYGIYFAVWTIRILDMTSDIKLGDATPEAVGSA